VELGKIPSPDWFGQVVASPAEESEMGVGLGEVIAGGCAALTSPFYSLT